jgi:hypothetical protein
VGKEQNSAGATFWWVFFGSRMAATEVGAPAMVEGMSQGLQDTTMSRFKGLDRMEDGWEEGVDINGGRRWCSMWVQLGLSLLDPSLGVAADSGPLQPPAWPQPSPTSSPLPILLIFHRRHLQHHRDNQFWPPPSRRLLRVQGCGACCLLVRERRGRTWEGALSFCERRLLVIFEE